MTDRIIPNTLSIEAYFQCAKCLKERPSHISPRDWAQLEIGYTVLGIQVWCKRHECNVVHVDFEGVKHPGNFTCAAAEPVVPELKPVTKVAADNIRHTLELAEGAYSADRYRSWRNVASALLRKGYTPKQAATIMRSKWTRWAADAYETVYGECPANAIIKFIDDPKNQCTLAEVQKMEAETFPN
jgi:hypothetical protein